MKLVISQPDLADLISKGGAVAPRTSDVAMLTHMKLSAYADDQALLVASCNMDRFAQAVGDAEVKESGETTVNAAALTTLIGRYPKDGVVSLETDGNFLIVKCGRSRVKLATLPAAVFPEWPVDTPDAEFTLAGEAFAKAFDSVRPAVGSDGLAYIFQGVYMHVEEGALVFAATNRHHVAKFSMPLPDGASFDPGVIIPRETIDIAMKLFKASKEVEVWLTSSKISFAADRHMIISKLIDGPYVNYQRAMATRGNPRIVVQRRPFAEAVARAALTTDDGVYSGVIAIPRDGGLELKTMRAMDGDESREGLDFEVDEGLEPFGFEPKYALNLANAFSGPEVIFEFGGKGDPRVLVYSDDEPDFVGTFGTLAINAAMVA